jgi:NAD(P)-dependent dehydrogenase (short-subunit alcohol dehydrogenase family)
MDLPKTTAFVSGANRGLGEHLADQLTSRGAGVHGGARKPGPGDLNRYLVTAFPGYGGTTMQRLQNYLLYPGNRRCIATSSQANSKGPL